MSLSSSGEEEEEEINQAQQVIDIEMELRELQTTVGKLKSKIPFNLIAPDDPPHPNVNWRPRSNPRRRAPIEHLDDFDDPNFVEEHQKFDDLRSFLRSDHWLNKRTFLRIFVFSPEKAIIKKSLLDYLEGTNQVSRWGPWAELPLLVSKSIIKPVYKTCNRTVSGFWMHPFIRSTLSAAFSQDQRKYLVNSIDDEEEDIIYDESPAFSAMKHLQFLHLGKLQSSSTQHIEMEDPNLYFKNIKKMDDLRYISFRGISMIKELPNVMKKSSKLKFLDLRSCYNLEAIPSDIGNLWELLMRLDMSECYFLDHMPASLSRLRWLRVLKGFYVGESKNKETCTLQDLASVIYLEKLNIYTSVKGFPNEVQLTVLQAFPYLRKLTISWGGCSAQREECKSSPPEAATDNIRFKEFPFDRLEKLDLQCVPNRVTRHWLKPSNFRTLKTLYIRGGQFNDLGGIQKDKGLVAAQDARWSVKTLRLKHLSKLQMDWSELEHLFPDLITLEKVQCPNLTSFPCDESGMWTKTTPLPPIPIPWYASH